MKNRLKYLGLVLGLLTVFLSFLFFGRRQNDYVILLITGLLLSSFFYLAILFGRHSKRIKISWTLVFFFSATLQWLTEPVLIDCSYKIFIFENGSFVAHSPGTIGILQNKPDRIHISKDTIIDQSNALSKNEKFMLYYKMGKLDGLRDVTKEKNYIYFGFEGSRHGIIYWTDKSKPDEHYRHLADNWYR